MVGRESSWLPVEPIMCMYFLSPAYYGIYRVISGIATSSTDHQPNLGARWTLTTSTAKDMDNEATFDAKDNEDPHNSGMQASIMRTNDHVR